MPAQAGGTLAALSKLLCPLELHFPSCVVNIFSQRTSPRAEPVVEGYFVGTVIQEGI